MTALAWVLVVAFAAAFGFALMGWMFTRTQLARAQGRIAELEEDLDAALRPRPAATATEKALRRVVRTVDRVREGGISGLLQSSIDELQAWAADERTEITSMAAADGTVTLFFSDIENSTTLNSKLGDGAWVKVLSAHDSIVRGQVDKYRGQVVKSAGDGFMVAFRDAEAACRAGLGIQKELRRSLDTRLRRVNPPVRVRIGVHTGEVVSRDGDYFGRNVAMAARVSDLAEGGEVLATEAVLESLDEDARVDLLPVGEYELKGLPGEHPIYRVEAM